MKKLETLRCVEVTSQRQADNGTLCFHDPITGCDYLSYESGYIRRMYSTPNWRGGKEINTIYQLNPTRKVSHTSQYNGQVFHSTERVLIKDPLDRLELLAKAVANYRKNSMKAVESK